MKYDLTQFLILALAAFRLTHLIVFDTIMEWIRRPLQGRPVLGTLVTCYWCAGIWVSAGLIAGLELWPGLFRWLILILGLAGGQVLIEWWLQQSKK